LRGGKSKDPLLVVRRSRDQGKMSDLKMRGGSNARSLNREGGKVKGGGGPINVVIGRGIAALRTAITQKVGKKKSKGGRERRIKKKWTPQRGHKGGGHPERRNSGPS